MSIDKPVLNKEERKALITAFSTFHKEVLTPAIEKFESNINGLQQIREILAPFRKAVHEAEVVNGKARTAYYSAILATGKNDEELHTVLMESNKVLGLANIELQNEERRASQSIMFSPSEQFVFHALKLFSSQGTRLIEILFQDKEPES